MKVKPKVAILLLSCDKYREVAGLSIRLLTRLWKDPPEIFVGGLSDDILGYTLIPFSVNPKDWIGIACQAVSHLLEREYDYCYLVLDDHPPVATCNGEYLGYGLPLLAGDLGATVVSMVGWDQVRNYQGVNLPADKHCWLRNDSSYRWLFNLHPACWDLSALHHILQIVMDTRPADHSARTFEGVACSPDTKIPDHYRHSSYRVSGDRFAVVDQWFGKPIVRKGLLQLLHSVRFSARIVGGAGLQERIDQTARLYTDYLNGPYPMFWSGLMQRGAVHDNAIRFLRLSGQSEFAEMARSL